MINLKSVNGLQLNLTFTIIRESLEKNCLIENIILCVKMKQTISDHTEDMNSI